MMQVSTKQGLCSVWGVPHGQTHLPASDVEHGNDAELTAGCSQTSIRRT